jgi:hypothetical protein
MENINLSLLPIETLFEEISRRTENAVFSYERFEGDDELASVRTLFKGNALQCIGLCEATKNHIINQFEEDRNNV